MSLERFTQHTIQKCNSHPQVQSPGTKLIVGCHMPRIWLLPPSQLQKIFVLEINEIFIKMVLDNTALVDGDLNGTLQL
jgi:hypothetical protein